MSTPEPLFAVDARMAFNSGIGVYFRNIFADLANRGEARFQVLAYERDIQALSVADRLVFTPVTSPIYSIAEQLEIPRKLDPRACALWTPHYNMPLLTRCRRLVTVHDVAHLAEPTINRRLLPRLYARALLTAVRSLATHVFFVSAFSETEFLRLIGAPRGEVSITGNAASAAWRNAETGSGFRTDQTGHRRYVVYVGNIKPHKNLGGLLRAFALLGEEADLDLVVVGKREGFIFSDTEVEGLAQSLGERVIFTGPLAEEALIDTVRGAMALVLPSFYEGFGIPPLEAMSVGTPTIVSDIPALRETCGEASLYIDPHDPNSIAGSIRRLLKDPALAARLSEDGLRHCASFSFRRSADLIMATLMAQVC